MNYTKFNAVFKEYFSKRDSDIKVFLHQKYINSGTDYYSFLDDFLFKYGVNSFNIIHNIDNNYPSIYIRFNSKNVFNENENFDVRNLKNQSVAEEQLANKLINLIHFTSLKNWIDFEN